MSLLLDALKRAEQEKLARQGERAPEREAANAPHVSASTAPASALELQPLAALPSPPGAKRSESAAHAAQVVFAAKTAQRESDPRGKGMVWVIVGVVVIVVVAAGAYVWYAISALAPNPPAGPRLRPPPLAAQSSGSIPQSSSSKEAGAAPASQPPFSPLPPPPMTAPAVLSLGIEPKSAPRKRDDAPRVEPLAAQVLAQSTPASPPPLRLSRTSEAPKVPGEVASGYAALGSGNMAAARRSYQAALASDSASLDARLGLATVEARSGNRSAAALQYRKALEVDSRNPTALAGLASLADFSRPEQMESQLREDSARNPESAALHFALGNVYVTRSRWREAQAEFFEAYRLDPGGADIAYNLAVSLDNLGQQRLAAEYYARALDSARTQAAQFDPAVVARRLAEIRP